jgi:hypothetical protein
VTTRLTGLAAVAVVVCVTTGATAPDVWRAESYADPMHKGARIAAASKAADGTGTNALTAVVRCWSATGDYDVRIEWRGAVATASPKVSWRFDRNPVRSSDWRLNPAGNALVVPDPLRPGFIRDLKRASALTLTIDPAIATAPLRIPLIGSGRALSELESVCGP